MFVCFMYLVYDFHNSNNNNFHMYTSCGINAHVHCPRLSAKVLCLACQLPCQVDDGNTVSLYTCHCVTLSVLSSAGVYVGWRVLTCVPVTIVVGR